jgi:hypothetical protein
MRGATARLGMDQQRAVRFRRTGSSGALPRSSSSACRPAEKSQTLRCARPRSAAGRLRRSRRCRDQRSVRRGLHGRPLSFGGSPAAPPYSPPVTSHLNVTIGMTWRTSHTASVLPGSYAARSTRPCWWRDGFGQRFPAFGCQGCTPTGTHLPSSVGQTQEPRGGRGRAPCRCGGVGGGEARLQRADPGQQVGLGRELTTNPARSLTLDDLLARSQADELPCPVAGLVTGQQGRGRGSNSKPGRSRPAGLRRLINGEPKHGDTASKQHHSPGPNSSAAPSPEPAAGGSSLTRLSQRLTNSVDTP